MEGTPPGDAPPPPPQRATPARKGARCGAGAGSPHPHRSHPEHTGRGTPAARPRGQAAGGGTAPDTRRPSQRWQASPPGNGPPPSPRHAGHAGKGDSVRPPHPHTHAHSTWVADPNSPPSGWAVGGGGAPDLRHLSQRWKAPPPGTPFRHPYSEQRRPARAHAVGPMLGPHARTNRTRDTRVAEPRLPAPEDGRLGEGQRLTPDAPHNGGTTPGDGPPPPLRHAAPTGHAGQGDSVGPPDPHVRAHSTWVADPNSPPSGRTVGGGTAPDTRRPSQRWQASPPGNGPPPSPRHAGHAGKGDSVRPPHPHTHAHSTWVADPNSPPSGWAVGGGGAPDLRHLSQRWKAPPPGTPFRHPYSEQRRPARAHAVGPMLGPHARTNRTRDTRVAEPRLPAPEDGRLGEGQRLTPDAPHNGGTTPGDGPPPPLRHAAPTGHAGQGDSVGPPDPHVRAHSTWVADPNSPPSGRTVGGGGAPDLRRLSQRRKAPPPGTPFPHPHSEQRRPARAHAVGPVLGTHAHTDRTQDTRVAEPRPPAPEDGRLGERQRLTPDAPHNGGRPTPAGTAPHHPRGTQPPHGGRPRGQCRAPTPTHPRPQHVGGGPQQPAQWVGSPGRGSA